MGEGERRIVVIGQTLLQLKKKKKQFYPWIFTFLLKKTNKQKNLIPFSVCSPLGQVLDPS